MRTIRTKVYRFDELNAKAKDKAIEQCRYYNVEGVDWYWAVYEDAASIGLKITEFNIDRGSYCEIEFEENHLHVAEQIVSNHGEVCDTYNAAKTYMRERDETMDQWDEDYDDSHENLDEVDSNFQHSLEKAYLKMLSDEYDYLTSDECVAESIESNGYEFTAEGKRI